MSHRLTVQYFEPADGPAFEAAYRERHVPLVRAVPGLRSFTLARPRGGDGTPYLVAELWFDDAAAFETAMTSTEIAATGADAETYDVARKVMFSGDVEDVT